MALRKINAFGNVFDVEVVRAGAGKLLITAKGKKYTIKEGATQVIKL